jgi:ABC-2 type transport system permease protein
MFDVIYGKIQVYSAIAATVPKRRLAYTLWIWVELIVQIFSLMILAFFWRAVYRETTSINGLNVDQTLSYMLLTQMIMPLMNSNWASYFGWRVTDGSIAIELLRPIDFQAVCYIQNIAELVFSILLKLPCLLIAWLFLGLHLPSSPSVWLGFLLTLLLGNAVLFFTDWSILCLSFYTSESWGLLMLRGAIVFFFSGLLVPLDLMPDWLRSWLVVLPFSQAVYAPVSLLSGIKPINELLPIITMQLGWLVAMAVCARFVFKHATRRLNIYGG